MGKIINITDKLNFESKPKLIIKDKEIEVNGDAPTMLKVMSLMGGDTTSEDILSSYEAIFSEESRKKLDELGLSFSDLITVIKYAIDLIKGDSENVGE